MITVIIPTLNEQETIVSVIKFAQSSPSVTEIIVVDDKSVDNTVKEALQTGVKVITSTKIGKGDSMKDGVNYASNEIIVFLDGDINPYPHQTIEKLIEPIISSSYDFVKGIFARQAGRITELVAKPLLSILFPNLTIFTQPLSGMIAGKKSFFNQIDFEEGYGVDIGILIDMYLLKAHIVEINIGLIANKMKPWQELAKMSKEVSRTIIHKALQIPTNQFNLKEMQSLGLIRHQMEFSIREELIHLKKMVIFDMDNTLLKGRFIDVCAEKFEFAGTLHSLRKTIFDPLVQTKKIAELLRGISQAELLKVADHIPIVEDAKEVIRILKMRGYMVGIISDSYDFVTNFIKNKIDADFSLANELEFSKSISTGEIKIPSFFSDIRQAFVVIRLVKLMLSSTLVKNIVSALKILLLLVIVSTIYV